MNRDDVTKAIEKIKEAIAEGDDEMAHNREDSLYAMVLLDVALGNPDSARLADMALKTRELEFARWCA